MMHISSMDPPNDQNSKQKLEGWITVISTDFVMIIIDPWHGITVPRARLPVTRSGCCERLARPGPRD